ncbi:radical SAM family RiPP maturation amino acid epimerase [Alteromonas sp. BMJM2]|uniref:radical SAM family RiPP maturation amino acid epimerase n=1 Tax=Alteromonas sp. BMJM2 TaxID=2954241 RepID=UPI0022B35CB5|nr:radical SAM family RiPP maturation amino acid epimerase [Alteromonas sp. BMJM2]
MKESLIVRLEKELAVIEKAFNDNKFRAELLERPETYFPEGKSILSALKMFTEIFAADPQLRTRIATDTVSAIEGLPIAEYVNSAAEFAPLWQERADNVAQIDFERHINRPLLDAYNQYNTIRLNYLDGTKNDSYEQCNNNYRLWCEVEKARSKFELGVHDSKVVHAPFAIELNQGCSVGCWFCGVSAEKLTEKSIYDRFEKEWKGICSALNRYFGDNCRKGFLYWATEPMDSTDYEKFQSDFIAETGYIPQVTTAVGHKHVDRIKRILREPNAKLATIHRFSCLSVAQLKRVHREFNSVELLFTECIPQNKESIFSKANAGKARNSEFIAYKLGDVSEEVQRKIMSKVSPSIACVSGFLINITTKNIKLISPCPATNEWPNGYRIYADVSYTDVIDFETKLKDMVNARLAQEKALSFIDGINVSNLDNGFCISSLYGELKFEHHQHRDTLHELVRCIQQETFSPHQLIEHLSGDYNVTAQQASDLLQVVSSKGVIEHIRERGA